MSAAIRVGRVTRRSRGFWLVAGVRLWNYLGVRTFSESCSLDNALHVVRLNLLEV